MRHGNGMRTAHHGFGKLAATPIVASVIVVLVLQADQAVADCASECEGERYACSESDSSSSCGTQFQICVQRCIGGAGSADNFGAIAFSSSTEFFGFSYDFDTREAAEARSVVECRKMGGANDCEVVVWFNRSCGALATDGFGSYGADWGATESEAESKALETCVAFAGSACSVRRSLCTN